MNIVLIAVGAGCLWHGAQIVWVAPTPSQFVRAKPDLQPGTPQAFQRFWLDQYAWIGITLCVLGVVLVVGGLI